MSAMFSARVLVETLNFEAARMEKEIDSARQKMQESSKVYSEFMPNYPRYEPMPTFPAPCPCRGNYCPCCGRPMQTPVPYEQNPKLPMYVFDDKTTGAPTYDHTRITAH